MNSPMKMLVTLTAAIVLAAGLVAVQPPQRSEAADASQFDPGNIISDALFFDGQAMSSASEIQQFLVNQVPVCRSSYACLTTYRTNTPTMAAAPGRCAAYGGRNSELAAEIIYRIGVACGISTKAMLVILEKEQSLVTSATPSKGRFDSATGMGCPDTAPCDPAFGGLFYQVYYAALQFKIYADSPGYFNYQAGRVNNILYHPDRSCGSSPVYIANQATAGLYNYTPYQPNAAALANLYGSGDGCSAYGNRNFWRLYTDWFGSTQANNAGAQAIAAAYASLGGAGGSLGAQLSGVVCSNGYRDCGVEYRLGSIYWSERTGAFPVYPSIRGAYWAAGGSAGPLGAPTSGPINIAANGGGVGQVFENGSVFSNPSAGAFPVYEPVRTAYFATSGAAGAFGWPTGNQVCDATLGSCTQSYQNGYVGAVNKTTSWSVTGRMAAEYRNNGGPAGALGVVTSNEAPIAANGGGSGQAFANGSIYAGSSTGIFAVTGNVKIAYFALSGSAGSLGWPTGVQACSASGAGCIQAFQNGYVSASGPKASQIITGRIAGAYTAAGGTAGNLGVATSAVVTIPQNGGGTGQTFEGGSIYDSPSLGAFAVSGDIRTEYWRMSGSAGSAGWPVGVVQCGLAGNGCAQNFQNLAIFSAGKTVVSVSPKIAPGYLAAGGAGGALGAAASSLITIPQNGGGVGQAFQGGSVYSSTSGSFAVSGAIRDEYFRQSGSAGSLGWPTGASSCSGGTCSQSFQNGRLSSSSAGTFAISGAILTAFDALGGTAGPFGAVTTAVIPIGAGAGQVFVGGSIYSSAAGAFGVSGAIKQEYFRLGGATGSLGWPTSAADCSGAGGACSQSFERGVLVSSGQSVFTVAGDIRTTYQGLGGLTGAFGAPISAAAPISGNGGGSGQAFSGGSIYSSSAGTFGVSGAIRTEYFRLSGALGSYGWPTGAAVCQPNGVCTQSFQGGTITR